MKISHIWLTDYLAMSMTPEACAAILTDTGLEVEKVFAYEAVPGNLEGVVVGFVRSLAQHPDADRLRVAQVDVGGEADLTIVCGAENIMAGQKVLVATVGTVLLPNSEKPLKIQKSKIRGVESFGMICAEDELGLGTSHDGIMVLPETAQVGTPAAVFLKLSSDWVYEIGLTPNRTDAFGHFGVARDLAARLNLDEPIKAAMPELATLPKGECAIEVEVKNSEACPRYSGIVLSGIAVAPSPDWLKHRLKAIGLQPINNVVDITNYVQHELGQPLHAFDLEKIKGRKIVVRTAPSGTKFTTLDGTIRELHSDDLLICDGSDPMCIAGVFGGAHSGVSASTTSIFLESAWFNASTIRKTAKRHDLHTDAAFRFERGVDPNGTVTGLARAVHLLQSICGAKVQGGYCDILTHIPEPIYISLDRQKLNAFLGVKISMDELQKILISLDIVIDKVDKEILHISPPSYRVDVTRDTDVYEEVLRIYGYNKVPIPERMTLSVNLAPKPEKAALTYALAQMLIGRGFFDTLSNGLTRSDFIQQIGGDAAAASLIAMMNPLSSELDVLRPHLFPSLLDTAAYNLNRQADRLQYFEVGTTYRLESGKQAESTSLGVVLYGPRFPENWNNPSAPFDGSDLRGHLEAIGSALGLQFVDSETASHAYLDQAVGIVVGKTEVGIFGRLSAKAAQVYGIKREVWLAELNLSLIIPQVGHGAISYREVERFPAVRRDLSVLLDRSTDFDQIDQMIRIRGGSLVKEVSLFDVYEGKNLPEGKKSYAVGILLQDPKQTLNDKRIDYTMKQVIAGLQETFGATLR